MRLRFWLFMSALISVGLIWATEPPKIARACTPPPGGLPKLTIADRAKRAPIVLIGMVTAVEKPKSTLYQIATITVSKYLKGTGETEIKMSNFGSGALCLTEVMVGGPYLIFAEWSEGNGYRAFYASQFDAVFSASDANIQEVLSVVGDAAQTVTVTVTPTPDTKPGANVPSVGGDSTSMILATIVVTVGVVIGIFMGTKIR